MKINKISMIELYDQIYGHYKYFNQHPWDVAMSKNVAEDFDFCKQKFNQDVINGLRDAAEYYVLLKLVLDSPLTHFADRN